MTLQIPDNIFQQLNLTEKELLVELGILFYQKGILSLKQSVELSKLSKASFKKALKDKGILLRKKDTDEETLPERYLVAQQFKGRAKHPDFPISKFDVYDQ